MLWFLVVNVLLLENSESHAYIVYDPVFETVDECQQYAIINAPLVQQRIREEYKGKAFQLRGAICAKQNIVEDILNNSRAYQN